MSNSKYSNEFIDRCNAFYKQLDGSMHWPNSREGDLLKIAYHSIEQTRTNTLKAALEAAPPKRVGIYDETEWEFHGHENYDKGIGQYTNNIKALIGGDNE